jgi:hypothetical protein
MTYRLVIAFVVLLFAFNCEASDKNQMTGVLQGHLKIISLQTVQPADGSLPTVTAGTYGEFPLVVLSSDGKQQIAVMTADAKGNYRVELPPGTYLLDIQNRVRKHVRAKPVPFTVASGQTVHVDMEMDTGIR